MLKQEVHTLTLAPANPRTRWYARTLLLLVGAYALRPLDLVPDFILLAKS